MPTPSLVNEFNRLYAPKPLETMSRDAVYQDRFFRTRAEAGIQHLDFEKSPPPFKNYDREIGGFLAGFIPLMWWLLLVTTGAWK